MKTNIVYYKSLKDFINNRNKSINKYLLFVASNTTINLSKFDDEDIEVYGARFPHVIYQSKLYEEGLVSIEICSTLSIELIKDVNNHNFEKGKYKNQNSLITILDGFCKDNEEFLSKLFENVDINTNIIGGGAGLLDEENDCIVFDNNKCYRNCAILLSMEQDINIGAHHGWDYLCGPFIATSSEKNILKTIDYVDAYDYYKKIIEEDSGIEINEDNFLEVSQNYPIGIIKYQGEQIVRDPVGFFDKNLLLLGEVSNNSMINILKGNKENLLNASKLASIEAKTNQSDFILLFDCISRKGFLGDNFQDELDMICFDEDKNILFGVTTLGEIANSGNRYINLLNKTCVIGGICS